MLKNCRETCVGVCREQLCVDSLWTLSWLRIINCQTRLHLQ